MERGIHMDVAIGRGRLPLYRPSQFHARGRARASCFPLMEYLPVSRPRYPPGVYDLESQQSVGVNPCSGHREATMSFKWREAPLLIVTVTLTGARDAHADHLERWHAAASAPTFESTNFD